MVIAGEKLQMSLSSVKTETFIFAGIIYFMKQTKILTDEIYNKEELEFGFNKLFGSDAVAGVKCCLWRS
jgi:hypothetical protein